MAQGKYTVILEEGALKDLQTLEEYLFEEVGLSSSLIESHFNAIITFIEEFAFKNVKFQQTRYTMYSGLYSRSYNKTWVVFFEISEEYLLVKAIIHGRTLKRVNK